MRQINEATRVNNENADKLERYILAQPEEKIDVDKAFWETLSCVSADDFTGYVIKYVQTDGKWNIYGKLSGTDRLVGVRSSKRLYYLFSSKQVIEFLKKGEAQ